MSRTLRSAGNPVHRGSFAALVVLLLVGPAAPVAGRMRAALIRPSGVPQTSPSRGVIVATAANRTPVLWREHRGFVLLVLALFFLQLALIAWLIVLQRRRRRGESALRRSEARNSAFLRMVPDLMFVMSRDGVYLDYHASDPRDLFVPPDQFLGRRMQDIFPADLAALFRRHFDEALLSDEPAIVEYSLPMPGGERHFETRLVRCDNETIMTIVRDVTPRHEAQEKLHRAQTELAQAGKVRALGELAAGIAHEVSQPLAAIITNARAGLRQLDTPSADPAGVREILEDIVADGQRASGVITHVRGMARQDPLHRAPLAINAVIDDVLTLTGRMLSQRRIAVRLDLAPALPSVVGDRIQLQQVLLNLVFNAADAMLASNGRGRALIVRSRAANGNVAVSVQDSGEGLRPADLDRIFTPFFTTKADGMGVGLSISRTIIEAHGGTLALTRNSPQGATFEFELPAAGS
jgi:C4-dicarboxylate-specific signal transduction histidine kinase